MYDYIDPLGGESLSLSLSHACFRFCLPLCLSLSISVSFVVHSILGLWMGRRGGGRAVPPAPGCSTPILSEI